MKMFSLPALAMALSVSLGAPAAVLADSLLGGIVKDTLRVTGTTIKGAGNIVTGTVDAAGNVVDASGRLIGKVVVTGDRETVAAGESVVLLGTTNDVYGYSIDARRYDLGRAIDVAEAREVIAHTQATELRTALDRVARTEANAQAEYKLTFNDAVVLARELDAINTRLARAVKGQPFESLVMTDSSGHQRMFVTTPQALSPDVKVISTRSVTRNGVTSTTTTTSTSSGTPSNTAILSVLDARRFRLEGMISDGLERQALAAEKAAQMQVDLNKLRSELASLQAPGASMSQMQALEFARQLDSMDSHLAGTLHVDTWAPLTSIDAASGTAQIVTDQFTNVIGLRDAGPELYISTLDARRRELQDIIASQEGSGTLAKTQAQDLRLELERAARLQADRMTSFGPADALPLAVSLDYVGNQIHAYVPTYGYVPLINDSRFIVSGGRVILIDDIMVRRAELQSRIGREFASGTISDRQHDTLRTEMLSLLNEEEQMRQKGSLTFKDSRVLYLGFDKVASHLDGYVDSTRRPPLSNR